MKGGVDEKAVHRFFLLIAIDELNGQTVYLCAGGFGSRFIVATPGVSAERTEILREDYGKTLKDSEFVEEAKKTLARDTIVQRCRVKAPAKRGDRSACQRLKKLGK